MTHELLQRIITGIGIVLFLSYSFFFLAPYVFSLLLLGILALILVCEMPQLYNYRKISSWFATIAYPITPFILLLLLNEHPQYRILVAVIFAISFTHDIGAYVTGKLFGKHKLCPALSPKKTIEGFVGGWMSIYGLFILGQNYHSWTLLPLSFLCAVVATVGDIFESWLKRRARVKDSGNLLPGHGGLLDRFDSILAVTVLVFIFAVILQWSL